jgi:anti-sigma factor RsiW
MGVVFMYTNCHMDEEEFERYSMGAMPEGATAPFEEHLLICESCQQRLAQTDVYVAAMRYASARFRSETVKPRLPWLRFPRLVPALAGLAVAIVAAGLWLGRLDVGVAHPFAVDLAATRGSAIEATAPAGRWLLLRLDLSNLPASPAYRMEMVDRSGNRVWQATVPARGSKADFKVPGTQPGVYFVRLYRPPGELLREYGFEVH